MGSHSTPEENRDGDDFDVEELVTSDGVALYRLLLQNPNAVIVHPSEKRQVKDVLRFLFKKDARLAFCDTMTAQEACQLLQMLLRRWCMN